MATDESFSYLEDHILFCFLIANQLCRPEDGPLLARLQKTRPIAMELRRMLGVEARNVEQMGNLVQELMRPRVRELLVTHLPGLSESLAEAREASSESSEPPETTAAPQAADGPAPAVFPLIEELRDKRVELGNRDRQLEAWADAAVLFTEAIEALESNQDLEAARRATAVSLRKHFLRTFATLGFQVLIPSKGDPFDGVQHIVEDVDRDEPEVPPSTVVRVVQWGYRLPNGRILKAKVIVSPDKERS